MMYTNAFYCDNAEHLRFHTPLKSSNKGVATRRSSARRPLSVLDPNRAVASLSKYFCATTPGSLSKYFCATTPAAPQPELAAGYLQAAPAAAAASSCIFNNTESNLMPLFAETVRDHLDGTPERDLAAYLPSTDQATTDELTGEEDFTEENHHLVEFLTGPGSWEPDLTIAFDLGDAICRFGAVSGADAALPTRDEMAAAAVQVQAVARRLLARRQLEAKRAAVAAAAMARRAIAIALRAAVAAAEAAADAARRQARQQAAIARHVRRARGQARRTVSVWR